MLIQNFCQLGSAKFCWSKTGLLLFWKAVALTKITQSILSHLCKENTVMQVQISVKFGKKIHCHDISVIFLIFVLAPLKMLLQTCKTEVFLLGESTPNLKTFLTLSQLVSQPSTQKHKLQMISPKVTYTHQTKTKTPKYS